MTATTSPEECERLHDESQRGLSAGEVETRRQQYGWNEIPEVEETLLHRLLRRFRGPIPLMIELAAVLSAVAQKWEDFAIITVLLVVNVGVDFAQESRARSALEVLKKRLARKAKVLRDGRWSEIEARELVPGDVIKLKIGDVVPADATLADGQYLQLDQSALTGESLPVDRQVGDLAYGNSIVKTGEMVAIVSATGLQSYFGKTVALVAQAEREQRSHFQEAVIQVGRYLIALAAALVVVIVGVSLLRHDPPMEILRFALVLTVASIPVALPAVLSVTMAVGAVRLARHQAIVSRLVAIEEMAGVDVLCSDKTGTLTQNRMQLGDAAVFGEATAPDVLFYAALASSEENLDPLEQPIFAALQENGRHDELSTWKRQRFQPFDPVSKRTEAEVERGGETLVVTKGAPQAVLALCGDPESADDIQQKVRAFALEGDRTLGVGVKRGGEESFRFVGLLPFFDPPREDSAKTIADARALGLDVKMLTGDNLAIAEQIARVLGIDGDIEEASVLGKDHGQLRAVARAVATALLEELRPTSDPAEREAAVHRVLARFEEEMGHVTPDQGYLRRHESEILEAIEAAGGFAQVFPEDKYQIVNRLQRGGHIVAMTGDGVNDAPALEKADAGIAVSGATDAARAAADVILVQPGLGVIVRAIEEARQIFGRMKSYAIFRIAETIRVISFMTLAILAFNFYPVTAVMIIILALLNDLPIMAIAYDNARVEQRPVRWDMGEILTVATALGLAGVVASFTLFLVLRELQVAPELIQALMFLKLSVAGHTTLYVARSGNRRFWTRPFPSLKLFVPAFGTQLVATLIAALGLFMTATGWAYAGLVWVYSLVWFFVDDQVKIWAYRFLRRRRQLATRASFRATVGQGTAG